MLPSAIFTARRYASAVYAVVCECMCMCVCLSVCHARYCIKMTKPRNTPTATLDSLGLKVSVAEDLREILRRIIPNWVISAISTNNSL